MSRAPRVKNTPTQREDATSDATNKRATRPAKNGRKSSNKVPIGPEEDRASSHLTPTPLQSWGERQRANPSVKRAACPMRI